MARKTRRVVAWMVGGLALVAAIVGLLVLGPNRNAAPEHFSAAPAQQPEHLVKAPLSQDARRVAVRFIQTAVARKNLDEAWTLVGPNLRGGLEGALDDRREPRRAVPGRQARRRTVQGRCVVHEERAARWRCSAQGSGVRAQVFFLELRKLGSGRVPVGRRQLGAQSIGGGPAMSNVADSAEAAANGRRCSSVAGRALPPRTPPSTTARRLVGRARGYWEGVWLRLERDKLALAGGVFIVLLFILTAFAARRSRRGSSATARTSRSRLRRPRRGSAAGGTWTHVGQLTEDGQLDQQLFVLGSDSTLARDEFLQLLYGAQVSLRGRRGRHAALLLLGSIAGAVAGFYRGWADTTISRLVDLTMAFPASSS